MARIVVGVTGGIAAYKSASLVRMFSESGHTVKVVSTKNAFRFIGQATLEALSGNPVQIVDPDLFTDVDQVKHVSIAKNADLIVVAPATASFLAKVAAGIADDLLTTTVLAASCKVVLAPAMHTEMWENQATKENVATLSGRGIAIVPPGSGRLTGEDSGAGRLAVLEDIYRVSMSHLNGPLTGLRVLVTAGGTRESIDAVRYIGNYSSGKQGIAFARAAQELGAEVHLVAANVDESLTLGIPTTKVSSTDELNQVVKQRLDDLDIFIMAAAVADFRPTRVVEGKIKRSEQGERLELSLEANVDILKSASTTLRGVGSKAIIVGFAAEASSDLERLGRIKLESKGCDYVVANDISGSAVFGLDRNIVTLLSSSSVENFEGSKAEVARWVIERIASNMGRL